MKSFTAPTCTHNRRQASPSTSVYFSQHQRECSQHSLASFFLLFFLRYSFSSFCCAMILMRQLVCVFIAYHMQLTTQKAKALNSNCINVISKLTVKWLPASAHCRCLLIYAFSYLRFRVNVDRFTTLCTLYNIQTSLALCSSHKNIFTANYQRRYNK